ncbi:MAG: glycosyltransferase family 9 protein [Burkholderiaceae bacterium]|nr:glycosyltransferase family 9 protein [Burkholderiaceae bacterium]
MSTAGQGGSKVEQIPAERGKALLRRLDRWLGIPLLYLIALFRPKKSRLGAQIHSSLSTDPSTRLTDEINLKRIGVCVFAAVGDALLAAAILADLKQYRNQIQAKTGEQISVTIFSTPANAEIFKLISNFDRLVLIPITSPWHALRTMRESIAQFPVDVLIDTSQWSKIGAILCALSGAKVTIGFNTPGQYRHFAYDVLVPHSRAVHEIDNFRALLSPLNISTGALPELDLTGMVQGNQALVSKPFIVLHPWASGTQFAMREWPLNSWLELGKRLVSAGYAIVITGGPDDQKRAVDLVQKLNASLESANLSSSAPNNEVASPGSARVISVAGSANWLETARLLNQAEAVVAVNTGTMHLAAILGRPLVALHGPTNPARWGPLTSGTAIPVILGPGLSEGGAYLHLGSEYPKEPVYLMDQISPDAVIKALKSNFGLQIA